MTRESSRLLFLANTMAAYWAMTLPEVVWGQVSHVDMPCIEYCQVCLLSIISDDREPLNLAGEIKSTTLVSIQVIPGAVQMFA